jgi:phytoene synthase
VPAASRRAIEALWRLDVTLGAILATGRDPMVGRIRLAWWREALERLDTDPPPPEPVLQALAEHVLPRGVSGADLAPMEEGWAELLADGALDEAALRAYAEGRGARLFRLSARLLGSDGSGVAEAGARWALADLARRSSDPAESRTAVEQARRSGAGAALNGRLKPLGMLAMLSGRDIERGPGAWESRGAPMRAARLLAYRLLRS